MSVGIRGDCQVSPPIYKLVLCSVANRVKTAIEGTICTVLVLHKSALLVRESKDESRTMTRGYYSALEP